MRFLLVEDNSDLADAVKDRLQLDGHVIDHAGDLETASHYVATVSYDLIFLDIMLPDGDGREFLAQHRRGSSETPVIVLTARSEVSDRVSLLDLGADDYMIKPIDFAELEARCRAVLRRRSGGARNTVTLGNVIFDPISGSLKHGPNDVQLRPRELRLFEVFANSPGIVFSKSNLVDRLFSFDEGATDNAIEVYVGRLRRHLSGSNVRLTTVRGLGYKLEID
ncbi:MAG: response regulator transcription factor [Pseudomonadota bacterium]